MRFDWEAVAGCPARAAVVAELERILGGPLADHGGRRLGVSIRVHREPDEKFTVRVQLVGDGVSTPERTMSHRDCAALARGAAHIAAVMIETAVEEANAAEPPATDPAPVEVEQPPDEPPEAASATSGKAEPPPPPPAPLPAPGVVSPLPSRREWPRGALRVGGGLGIGDLPDPVAVVRVTGAVLWRRTRLELGLTYEPLARIRSDAERYRRAYLQYVAAAARACPVLYLRRLEWPLCAGVEAGVIVGRTYNFAVDSRGAVALVAIHVAPAMFYRLHPRVAIGVLVEGSLRLLRPRVIIVDYGQIYRSALATVRVLTAIEVRFL